MKSKLVGAVARKMEGVQRRILDWRYQGEGTVIKFSLDWISQMATNWKINLEGATVWVLENSMQWVLLLG